MINTMMEHKGFKAQVMEAERLTGDYVHELPPGSALPVYPVDMLLEPPESWMKGPGVFVIPVKPNKGLWFNWTQNSDNNTAVIPTVKGCNPITGMQTSGFHMERYENKCPKHGTDFLHDRFCPECNYKWPAQNYVGPKNTLWWDGFLNVKDGTVRQFFFSEEELRDVATTLIGKENTVPAFGFAFYASKERRQEPAGIYHNGKVYDYVEGKNALLGASINNIWASNSSVSSTPTFGTNLCCDSAPVNEEKTSGGIISSGTSDALFEEGSKLKGGPIGVMGSMGTLKKMSAPRGFSKSLSTKIHYEDTSRRAELRCAVGASMDEGLDKDYGFDYERERSMRVSIKEVSIGAGAKINQSLKRDPFELDSWKETPDSVMTIYFVFQDKFEELKSKGVRDLDGSKEGMLSNCIVG